MCTHANTTKSAKSAKSTKSARTAETATTADPVDMADPICSCTKCYCRIIVPFPGSLSELHRPTMIDHEHRYSRTLAGYHPNPL
ncbi:hypothetical protein CDV31_000971 [Fusarium ambrosium]|uniref:Uncharacterized protein n=1 Tax=Fusarium ambrosium TaxID=131363 RepID=A0A428V121_9HYPO|nr:hypothetical protein CDV31_000971 [Fusarium ambrosium]